MNTPLLLLVRLFLGGFILSFVPFAALAAEQDSAVPVDKLTKVSVQLNWSHQFEFAGIYAAIQQGFYRDAGLQVEIKPWRSGILATNEVVSRRADFAVGYSSVIVDAAKGEPIRLVMAAFQYSPMVLLSHQPIDSLEQLSGKSVMHYGDLQVNALLRQVKELGGKAVRSVTPSGNLQDFIDHKVDIYAAYATNEPFRLRQAGVPFYIVDPKSFGIQSYSDILITHEQLALKQPNLVKAMRDATIAGWQFALQHPQTVVDFILENYPVKKNRDALQAEAIATQRFILQDRVPIGDLNPLKVAAVALEARNQGFMSAEQLQTFDAKRVIFAHSTLELTDEERLYLQRNRVISVGIDSYWEPFEFVDKDGHWQGLSADYFRLLGQRLGVEFKPVRNKPWHEVVEAAKNGTVKVLSCAVATPERKQFLHFTKPYLSFPLVMVANNSVNFIDDYSKLNGKIVAVPKGYWSHEWIAQHYPQIKLLLVNSVKEGLEAVLHGKAQAFSGNLASINFAIKRYGLQGLHIVGDSGVRFDLAVGATQQEPILRTILQKGLDSIDNEQRDEIYRKWIQLEVVSKTDNRLLIGVILVAALVILLVLWIARVFYRQKRQQAFYINRANELAFATYVNAETHKIEWASESFLKLSGCCLEQVIGKQYEDFLQQDKSQTAKVLQALHSGQNYKAEIKSIGCDGREYWVEITVAPDFDGSKLVGAWTTRVDITDKKRLQEIAVKDALTGVYNRHQFNELLEPLLHKANRNQSSFSIVMFDVDYFKSINDEYGHQKGDEVLIQLAKLAKEYFSRSNDILFRIGGEEFILIGDNPSLDQLAQRFEAFRQAVEDLQITNRHSPYGVMTISAGVLYLPQVDKVSSSQVYSMVDGLLYQAKQNGRNNIVTQQSV